jgi:anti-anti-sigma factor
LNLEKPLTGDLARKFREATDLQDPIGISVARPPELEQSTLVLDFPFGVIGRAKDCHVPLSSSKVSYRHTYLQGLAGGIYCIDLESRNGIQWSTGQKESGWLLPDDPVGIGPYLVGLSAESGGQKPAADLSGDFNPLVRYRQQLGPLPDVDIEFLYDKAPQPTWSVSRLITLVGRGPQCKLRFESKSVSTVHCSLVLTSQGLWVVDLLGREGTHVNGESVQCALLKQGDELTLGRYRIGIRYIETSLSENSATADKDVPFADEDGLESPFLEPQPLEWLGSIFRIEGYRETLIVLPIIDGCSFRYQQLQTEANSLRRKFELQEYHHLLLDLAHLHYFGSELIGVLISLARKVTDSGGRAAMCGASDKMMEVLKNMSLHKLWPYFKTREEALRAFEQ